MNTNTFIRSAIVVLLIFVATTTATPKVEGEVKCLQPISITDIKVSVFDLARTVAVWFRQWSNPDLICHTNQAAEDSPTKGVPPPTSTAEERTRPTRSSRPKHATTKKQPFVKPPPVPCMPRIPLAPVPLYFPSVNTLNLHPFHTTFTDQLYLPPPPLDGAVGTISVHYSDLIITPLISLCVVGLLMSVRAYFVNGEDKSATPDIPTSTTWEDEARKNGWVDPDTAHYLRSSLNKQQECSKRKLHLRETCTKNGAFAPQKLSFKMTTYQEPASVRPVSPPPTLVLPEPEIPSSIPSTPPTMKVSPSEKDIQEPPVAGVAVA